MSETLRAADSEDLPGGLGLVGNGRRRRGGGGGGGEGSISSQMNMSNSQHQISKQYKIDLYSVPVFLFEICILSGLAYAAYYIHFQYDHKPLTSGFYCDDIAYRHQFNPSTRAFILKSNELTVTVLLLAIPIVVIIFCELVNSMFGALNFRQIRALCACCKLHSITRRTLRFSAAYLLGFLLIMISCDILATSAGRLRPYFAQDCPNAYKQCSSNHKQARDVIGAPILSSSSLSPLSQQVNTSEIKPVSQPIQTLAPTAEPLVMLQSGNGNSNSAQQGLGIIERQWIDLTGQDLNQICNQFSDQFDLDRIKEIGRSWPSFPAAIVSYAILFTSCYLCFIGTARPFRLLTCVLVMILILISIMFNVFLVKEHFQHWEDVCSSSVLALIIVIFILYVYLNKFRDVHYYEDQKLYKSFKSVHSAMRLHEIKGYSNDGAIGDFNNNHFDKDAIEDGRILSTTTNGHIDQANVISSNDLAMRYFQIPRANYRGAPRPISTLNQML